MKLRSIQLLRGLAVLLVVLYHMRGVELREIAAAGSTEAALLGGLWLNGYAGVDIFFAISGFIMIYIAGHLLAGPRTAASFMFSRITRIYPLWWLCAGMMVVYFMATYGHPLDLERATSLGQTPAEHLTASFFLLPQNNLPVLTIGWTLVHEMYFYIVFALLLLCVPFRWRIAVLLIWASAVAWGAARGFSGPHSLGVMEIIFSPLTLEFVGGALAAIAVRGGLRGPAVWVAFIAGAALILALNLVPADPEPSLLTLEWGRVLWFGLPGVLLVYAFAAIEVEKKNFFLAPLGIAYLTMIIACQLSQSLGLVHCAFVVAIGLVAYFGSLMMISALVVRLQDLRPRRRVLKPFSFIGHCIIEAGVAIGNWSYSLYLSHILVLNGMVMVMGAAAAWLADIGALGIATQAVLPGQQGATDNIAFVAVSMLACLFVGRLIHHWFEAPLIEMFGGVRRRLFPVPAKTPAVQT